MSEHNNKISELDWQYEELMMRRVEIRKLKKEIDTLKILMIQLGITFGDAEDMRLAAIAVKS